jgi:multiple sugar transport system permease protein
VRLWRRDRYGRLALPADWRNRSFWKDTGTAYLYILPSILVLSVFVFYPFFSAFRLSLYKWSSLRPPGDFVGFQHYVYLFGNRIFLRSLWNTFYYVAVSVPLTLLIALFIASVLDKALRFLSFYRVSYFLPYISPVVALVMVWRWMYNTDYGLINYFIELLDKIPFININPVNWFREPAVAIPMLIAYSVWKFVGYQAVILLAGLQGIDKMYYDAAKIDGASGLQVWRKVTLPLLSPQIFFVFVISLIGSFKIFTEVDVLFGGGGGPLGSARTVVYYIVEQGLRGTYRMGRAAAASVILFGIIFALTIFQMLVTQRRVHYQ